MLQILQKDKAINKTEQEMIQANAEYFRIHNWINYHYGKARRCENKDCVSKNPKRFEWALRHGMNHERNIENYIQLCPSCHRKYDFTEKQRNNMSLSAKGRTFSNETRQKLSLAAKDIANKPVMQKTLQGEVVSIHNSVSIAAKHTGILQSSISNTLTKRSRTAGGFIWEYK